MTKKDVILDTISTLEHVGWTDKFERSVSNIVGEALGEKPGIGSFSYIASFAVCGMKQDQDTLLQNYFAGDRKALDRYLAFAKQAKENGFQMPSWGTLGT